MQRYNSWLQTLTPDFWTEKFKPKDILRVTSHAASILSLPTDISLLARYDINEINEHTVGITKVWQEFEFGELHTLRMRIILMCTQLMRTGYF